MYVREVVWYSKSNASRSRTMYKTLATSTQISRIAPAISALDGIYLVAHVCTRPDVPLININGIAVQDLVSQSTIR